jgi:DNA-binding MarR family transcriptional regulator
MTHGPAIDATSASRLRRAVGRISRELNEPATAAGLTPTQASVLAVVTSRGPLRLQDLVGLEQINPTMLSRVIGKLDTLGYVRRAPSEADQRVIVVTATPSGGRVNRRIRAQRTAVLTECVATLSARQAAMLANSVDALEALANALDKRRG